MLHRARSNHSGYVAIPTRLVEVLVECAWINQNFMQVHVLPIWKIVNWNDGSGSNKQSVHVLHLGIHTGNTNRCEKILYPVFKCFLLIIVELLVEFNVII